MNWMHKKVGHGEDENETDKELICPDCGCAEFYLGPKGGASINVKCAKCGSRFNVPPPPFEIERI